MIALLVLVGVALLVIAIQLRRGSAPPVAGELVYSNTDKRAVTAPINSHISRLTGKPDYIYRVGELSVPVELKKHIADQFGPRASDIVQLMAYCVLLENASETVEHGVGRVFNKRYTIPYTPDARSKVLAAAEHIKRQRGSPDG